MGLHCITLQKISFLNNLVPMKRGGRKAECLFVGMVHLLGAVDAGYSTCNDVTCGGPIYESANQISKDSTSISMLR